LSFIYTICHLQRISKNLKKQLEDAYSDLQGRFAENVIDDRGRERGSGRSSERGREKEDFSRSRSVKMQRKIKNNKNDKDEGSGGGASNLYLFDNSENIKTRNSENDIIDNDIHETFGEGYDYSSIIKKKLTGSNTSANSNSGSFNTLPYAFSKSTPYMRKSLQTSYIDENTAQSQISELDLEIGMSMPVDYCLCVCVCVCVCVSDPVPVCVSENEIESQ
jgi:hypothetical protein